MTSNVGLHLFLQNTPPNDEQLFALLDLRMEAIKPLIEDYVKTPLKEHLFIDHRGRNSNNLRFGDSKGETLGGWYICGMDLHCWLFPAFSAAEKIELPFWNEKDEKYFVPAHYVYHWGLDSDGSWVLVKAEFVEKENESYIHNVWPEKLDSSQALCERLKLTPRDLLNRIFETVRYWTDGARSQYQELERLQNEMFVQNYALKELENK